jgi:hypothetical protein
MQRLVSRIVIAAFVFVMLPSAAFAQTQSGDKEILLFGNLTSTRFDGGGTSTFGLIFINVGVFLTDKFEVGGGPNISVTGGGFSGGTDATVGINGFVRQAFGSNPKVQPYVGAEISMADLNPSQGSAADLAFVSAIGGVKNFISEKAALDLKGSFGFLMKEPSLQQQFGFTVGLTFVF